MHVLKFVEIDTGVEMSFDDFDVQPLGFDLLRDLGRGGSGTITLPLIATNARRLDSSGEPIDEPRRNVKAVFETDIAVDVRALVMGGWLPPGLVPHRSILMLDACALSVIRGRYRDGRLLPRWSTDFLDMLQDRVARVSLVPLLLEGNRRGATMTMLQLEQIYDDAAAALRKALPNAKIEGNKQGALQGTAGLMRDDAELKRRQVAFLKSVMPTLGSRPATAKLTAHWERIATLAREQRLRMGSPIVLAALSALVAPPSTNPAQKLLKPRPGYTDAHAHNALSDLNALRVLIAAHGDFPEDEPVLLTQDRNLALFWAGLGVQSSKRSADGLLQFHLNPHEALFPGEFGPRLIELASSAD